MAKRTFSSFDHWGHFSLSFLHAYYKFILQPYMAGNTQEQSSKTVPVKKGACHLWLHSYATHPLYGSKTCCAVDLSVNDYIPNTTPAGWKVWASHSAHTPLFSQSSIFKPISGERQHCSMQFTVRYLVWMHLGGGPAIILGSLLWAVTCLISFWLVRRGVVGECMFC